MKRQIIAVIAGMLFISSCDFGDMTIPTKANIKGDPVIEVPFGNKLLDLEELGLDIVQTLDETADPEAGITRVPTLPGEPLALNMQPEGIEIFLADFMTETINIGQVNQTLPEQTFTIPDLAFASTTIEENIAPIPLPGDVGIPSINIGTLGEPSISSGSQTLPLVPVSAANFTSITFQGGQLEAVFNTTNASAGLVINVESARILDTSDGSEIVVASNTPIDVTTGTPLIFPLDGITLPSNFDVELVLDLSGGDNSNFELAADFSFAGSPAIAAASGINFNQSVGNSSTFPVAVGPEFQQATIGTGDFTINLDVGTWTGISTAINIDIYQLEADGVTRKLPALVSDSGVITNTGSHVVDLTGMVIDGSDLEVAYTFDMTGTGAEVAFVGDGSATDADYEVAGDVDPSITLLSEVVVDPGADFDLSQSISEELTQDITDLVDDITFVEDPIIELTINNQLPMDIDITIDSPELGVASVSNTFTSGSDNTGTPWTVYLLGSSASPGDTPTLTIANIADDDTNGTPELDLSIDVAIPGYNPDTDPNTPDYLTLTNIDVSGGGTDYTFSGSVVADLVVDTVSIASQPFAGAFPEGVLDTSDVNNIQFLTTPSGTPVDLSTLGDVLPDTLTFSDITGTLDLSLPSGIILDVVLTAYYLDETSALQTAELISSTGVNSSTSLPLDNLNSLISARPSSLAFYYDIAVTGDSISVSTESTDKFAALININVPLTITSTGDSELLDEFGDPIVQLYDPLDTTLTDQDKDFLGRTGLGDELNEYLDMAKGVSISGNLTNTIGLDLAAEMVVLDEFGFEDSAFGSAGFTLGTGPLSIGLTEAQIDYMVLNYPFTPTVRILVPDGTYSILTPNDVNDTVKEYGFLDLSDLAIKLETNVDYNVEF